MEQDTNTQMTPKSQPPQEKEKPCRQLIAHLPDILHRSKTPACTVHILTALLSFKTEKAIAAVREETETQSQGSPRLTPHNFPRRFTPHLALEEQSPTLTRAPKDTRAYTLAQQPQPRP